MDVYVSMQTARNSRWSTATSITEIILQEYTYMLIVTVLFLQGGKAKVLIMKGQEETGGIGMYV